MTRDEVRNIVKADINATYIATYNDGKKKKLRFFIGSLSGDICQYKYKARNKGYNVCYLNYDNVISLVKKGEQKADTFKRFMKRARSAQKMLENSGLWENIKEELDYFISLSEDEQREMVNDIIEDSYKKFYCQSYNGGKYAWVKSTQVFESFANKKCWASFRYLNSQEKAFVVGKIKEVLNGDREEYSHSWTNGYYNSIEILRCEDGKLKGWFSAEYVGCGNGHYYLLFDAEHAIFFEDD